MMVTETKTTTMKQNSFLKVSFHGCVIDLVTHYLFIIVNNWRSDRIWLCLNGFLGEAIGSSVQLNSSAYIVSKYQI